MSRYTTSAKNFGSTHVALGFLMGFVSFCFGLTTVVTHSDALIREAVGKLGFNVYHMLPCGTEPRGSTQLRSLKVSEDLELVLTDLVGDLAAYRPGGKGLIFEGGGVSEFDKKFVGTVFVDELRGINLISGTNKSRVKALRSLLPYRHALAAQGSERRSCAARPISGPRGRRHAIS
jgi:hypothetical protein